MTTPPLSSAPLLVGWAEVDITPEGPMELAGQFNARLSEEVKDPLRAVVALFSSGQTHFAFVGCDLICISTSLRTAVRRKVAERLPGFPEHAVILNATHTHTAPETRLASDLEIFGGMATSGVDLGAIPREQYVESTAEAIAGAIAHAWNARAPMAVAYGMDEAVIARNRRWVDHAGTSTMYRLKEETLDRFSHIEGYEDHTLNLLATYTEEGALSGLVINLAVPAQADGSRFYISADFWHETREELSRRMGRALPILGQCSAAGDLTERHLWGQAAYRRMLELRGRTHRQEIAVRIADAVERILPAIQETREQTPRVAFHQETIRIPLQRLEAHHAASALAHAKTEERAYAQEIARLEEHPEEVKENPRWYLAASRASRTASWHRNVAFRYERQQAGNRQVPMELNFIRIGEVAFATNPVELYLDYGLQLKVRSPFLQTFLVQLCGDGSYIPSQRSVVGGGYGSQPESNPVGPEGGAILVEETLRGLRRLKAEE